MITSLNGKAAGTWKRFWLSHKEPIMMTTENSGAISEDEESYKDQPDNDNGKTQAQIDREEQERQDTMQRDHAQVVQDKQHAKLNPNDK
jgi:hypothetical protein